MVVVCLGGKLASSEPEALAVGKSRPELVLQLGHSESVNSVAFSPDGRQLASGGGKTIKVWNPNTGQFRATLLPFPKAAEQITKNDKKLPVGGKASPLSAKNLSIGAKGPVLTGSPR